MRSSSRKYFSKNDPSTYAKQIDKIRPTSTSSSNVQTSSAVNSEADYRSSASRKTEYSSMSRPTNVKTIMAKLTGVGHVIIPKDIKQQKWLISVLLSLLFMCASVANGIIIYGIEKVIRDQCYSPFNKIYQSDKDEGYMCPSFPGGFIKKEYAIWIRFFELGSTIHAISLGIATSAVYYLNFTMILIYIMFFLAGLTLMLISTLVEILFVKAGLFVYFSLSNAVVISFLAFFLVDVIHLFASINLEIRWINYLSL